MHTESPKPPTWGEGIKTLRGVKDWTQTDLATKAGVAQSRISDLERGLRRASDLTRIRIARALGVDPNVLFPYVEDAVTEDGAA